MRLPRRILPLLAATALAGAGFAAAATLVVASTGLGDGGTTVTGCQTSSLTFSHVVDSSHVVKSVTLGNIAGGCGGAVLSLNLVDSSNTSIGAATTTLPGTAPGYVTLTIPQQPASTSVADYSVGFTQ
jgi:hypothetical protein